MNSPENNKTTGEQRVRLDFRSGGWVLLLAGLLVVGIVVWQFFVIWPTLKDRDVHAFSRAETYGFDLSNCLVERDLLVAAGPDLPRDGMPVPLNPPTVAASAYTPGSKLGGVKKLLAADRVVGLSIGGEARAYPLWILAWHEIVNDTLGGQPIAVTYSPLCDSAVVFDRRLGERTVEFGISGLVFNSNLVMYDRDAAKSGVNDETRGAADGAAGGESLWSQLQFRAIAGPAAGRGEELTILPAAVTTWDSWLALHPQTDIMLPMPGRGRLYKRDAYLGYFANEHLIFPVRPLPPTGERELKTRIVAVREDGAWHVEPAEGFDWRGVSPDRVAVPAFWFAWYANERVQGSGFRVQ